MFAEVDPAQWGAGDVSISAKLEDGTGRAVWLYGDTASARPNGFVHSSAIVQTGGCLHVSRRGAQLLPDDDPTHIYWIWDVIALPTVANREFHYSGNDALLWIQAQAITLTGKGVWDFRDGGYSRSAVASVDAAGDVWFVRWAVDRGDPGNLRWGRYGRVPDPGPMYKLDSNPHHIGYSQHPHFEATLASGETLWTTCQNWDDGKVHPFADYRPIFTEGSQRWH